MTWKKYKIININPIMMYDWNINDMTSIRSFVPSSYNLIFNNDNWKGHILSKLMYKTLLAIFINVKYNL